MGVVCDIPGLLWLLLAVEDLLEFGIVKVDHLLPISDGVLDLGGVAGATGSRGGVVIDACLLLRVLLGLAQLYLRGHLLQAVDSRSHQHHGRRVLRKRTHVTRVKASRLDRVVIGHLGKDALLRDAEALSVRSRTIEFVGGRLHDLAGMAVA